MPFLPSIRSSPYSNHTDFVQPTLAKVNRRVYYSDGDITYSSGDGRDSDHSNGLSVAAIVGIVFGGLAFLILSALIFKLVSGLSPWLRERMRPSNKGHGKQKKPLVGDGGGPVLQGNHTSHIIQPGLGPNPPIEIGHNSQTQYQ